MKTNQHKYYFISFMSLCILFLIAVVCRVDSADVWVEDVLTNVIPGDTIPGSPETKVEIHACKNEWESGQIAMCLDLFTDNYGPGEINTLAIYTHPGTDLTQLEIKIRESFPGSAINISRSSDIRDTALRIFDQTFEVVRILQVMSLIIAACAITLTLLILARERISELALYRVLGALKSQIFIHNVKNLKLQTPLIFHSNFVNKFFTDIFYSVTNC